MRQLPDMSWVSRCEVVLKSELLKEAVVVFKKKRPSASVAIFAPLPLIEII
jgi:hypothetical protein